mgnify:CR=1 FL=1
MKKFGVLLSFMFMLSSSFFIVSGLTSCDPEDTLNIDGGGSNGSGTEEDGVSGSIKTVNTTLTYNSNLSNANLKSAFSASSGSSVALSSSDADIVFMYQSDTYHNIAASPNASIISQIRSYNSISYTAPSRYTKIKKVSNSISYYADIETLANMSVSTDYVYDNKNLGYGISNFSNGDVIIYETSSGEKGALQLSSTMSKVFGTITVKGYIYLPNSSSSSK